MKRAIFFLLLLSACSVPAPAPVAPLELSLSASATEGQAPLDVRFFADAKAERYAWTVAGRVLGETSAELLYTFDSPGLYVVGVRAEARSRVGSATLTVTVTADEPEEPQEPIDPGELSVSQTPGGPAPWAVRYDARPLSEAVQGRCSENTAYRPLVEGALYCVHQEGETASFELAGVAEADQRVSAESDVGAPTEGVAFLGAWRYRSRGVTETFEIVRGNATSGWSEDNRFRIFTIRQNGVVIVEFTLDGRTVVLVPLPEDDGRQVYFGGVYGLHLERLDDVLDDLDNSDD